MKPFIAIDNFEDSEPIYRRIYTAISNSILGGQLLPGTKLPSSRSLAAELGVSRMTVTNAYEQLLAEGYIEGKHGSGTYVASRLPEEFLRIERKEPRKDDVHFARNPRLSEYGEFLRSHSTRIADHHSPSMISAFQHSLPAMREFPFDIWSKIVQRKLKYQSRMLAGYGEAMGFAPLRGAIAEHLRSTRGVECEDGQVMITSGIQQAIYLISRILLSNRDTVWLEDPCHLGARDVFSATSRVENIPIDESGFDIGHAMLLSKKARLVYVTPSRQFPLGITMGLDRRLTLLEWAHDNDAWIVEDDYDSEFRYTSRPLPSLQGLDRSSRVLYLGTFSKTLFPGLRLGCVVLPPDLVNIFTAARSLIDLHGALIDQIVLAEFITEGHFERHIRRMRTLYKERQEILVTTVARELGGEVSISSADAGMHLVGWLSECRDDRSVSVAAREQGVFAAPISRYATDGRYRPGLLLGYTAFDENEIRLGVRKLARALDEK